MHILKKLGFEVEIKLWYSLAINYLQILGLSQHEDVPQQVWNYCNDMYILYSSLTNLDYARPWCVYILRQPWPVLLSS